VSFGSRSVLGNKDLGGIWDFWHWLFFVVFFNIRVPEMRERGLKLRSEATADSRDSVAGCSASQRFSSLIRSSQRDRPPSCDK
jgi:hypothetical protein